MATAAVLVVLTFAWPTVAGVLSGSSGAYWASNAAWRNDGRPLGGWLTGLWARGLHVPAVLIAVLLAALVVLRWRNRYEDTPPDRLGSWASVYLLYILLTAPPSAGIVRHALLALVLLGQAGPMAQTRSRRARAALTIGVVVSELVLQYLWVRYVFVVENPEFARIP